MFNFAFTPEGLAETLPIMGKGMLGTFVVIAIIVIVVAILNKVTAPKN